MDQNQYIEVARNFASMGFGDKIKASIGLAKQHAGKVLSVLLVAFFAVLLLCFILFSIAAFLSGIGLDTNFDKGGMGVLLILSIILIPLLLFASNLLHVGISSLILRLVEKEQVYNAFELVLNPFKNFKVFLGPVGIWLSVYIGLNIIFTVLGFIPVLGLLINLAGMIILPILNACIIFYMADHATDSTISFSDMFRSSFNIIKNDWLNWILSFAMIIAVYMPVVMISSITGAIFGLDSKLGIIVAFLIFIVFSIILLVIILFFMGLTYRQSHARLYIQ